MADQFIDDVGPILGVITVLAGLVGVTFLPVSVRRSLAFEYAEPTVLTAYTAPFVHFSLSHLVGNLLVFLLTIGVIHHLGRRDGTPWILLGALVVVLSAFPATLSFLNLAIPRNGVTYGFSGVNMAFVGFLPIAIVQFIERRLRRSVDTTLLLASFFGSIALVTGSAVPRSPISISVLIAAATLTMVFGSWFVVGERRRTPRSRWLPVISDPSLLIGLGTWTAVLSVAFPSVAVSDGSVVNVYVHFVGYALGFTTAYLGHEWGLLGDRPNTEASGGEIVG